MLRDALGSVAAQSSVSTANPGSRSGTSLTPTWSLHDRAGSPIAQTTPTGALTDTASYSDFGVQQFPTTGLNLYLSRAYDPFAGSWLTADTFRGTATDSQTQNRYAFVGNNPTTHQDVLGFASGGLFGSIISFVTTVVKKVVTVGKKVVAAAQSVFNATAQLIKGAAQSIASTVKDVVTTVGNAAKSVGKAVGKTASDAAKWIARHAAAVPWQDVLAVVITVASVVGGIAAAAACIASVVCGVAAGIAIGVGIGIATGAALYTAENAGTNNFTAQGLLTAAAIGGASGLIAGTIGAAAMKIGGTVSGAVARKAGEAIGDGIGGNGTPIFIGTKAIAAGTRTNPWAGTSYSRVTESDEVMYRVWGGGASREGGWLTPNNPTSSSLSRQGLALPEENTATQVSKVIVPQGTRIQVGEAAQAFGQSGGWAQVQLLGRLPSSQYGLGTLLTR